MSEWIELIPFGYGDVATVDGATRPGGGAATSATLPINLTTDYLLRDFSGQPITDSGGNPISLEGFNYA